MPGRGFSPPFKENRPPGRFFVVALVLRGDARGHLGDAAIAADGVVLGGDFRVAEMEEKELVGTSGTDGGGIHIEQQVGVALGVNDDHHVTAQDVLADDDFGEARLADAGSAFNQGVTDAVAQILPNRPLAFIQPDRVQPGIAFERRHRLPRVQPPQRNLEAEEADAERFGVVPCRRGEGGNPAPPA